MSSTEEMPFVSAKNEDVGSVVLI